MEVSCPVAGEHHIARRREHPALGEIRELRLPHRLTGLRVAHLQRPVPLRFVRKQRRVPAVGQRLANVPAVQSPPRDVLRLALLVHRVVIGPHRPVEQPRPWVMRRRIPVCDGSATSACRCRHPARSPNWRRDCRPAATPAVRLQPDLALSFLAPRIHASLPQTIRRFGWRKREFRNNRGREPTPIFRLLLKHSLIR